MAKKAAIITLHRVYNFGSALQAYATKELVSEFCKDVTVIDYRRHQDVLKNRIFDTDWSSARTIPLKIKRIGYLTGRFFSILVKEATIGRFVRKNLKLTKEYKNFESLVDSPPTADILITGSDQTWNSKYNNGIDRAFFLCFGDRNAKRIAFCASIGKTVFDEFEKNTTVEYLEKYSAISVREKSAKKLLDDCGVKNVQCLIDPTLQLPVERWKTLASKRLIKERYLLLVLLYNEDFDATRMARSIADEKGLKLVKLSWELIRPASVDILMTHRTPYDFLSLFLYADYVVTNSFHGLCFTLNFNKQFIAIKRNEFNSRLEDLLKLVNLENRIVNLGNFKKISNTKVDYLLVNEIISEERIRAREFLESSLGE